MPADLTVSTPALRDAGEALLFVHRELDAAADRTDVGPEVIADQTLRRCLQDVGTGWNRRRLRTMAQIASLAEQAEQAACTYEDIERSLTHAWAGRP